MGRRDIRFLGGMRRIQKEEIQQGTAILQSSF